MLNDFCSPTQLDKVLQFVRRHADAIILGGGTDLMIKIKNGRCQPVHVLNICNVKELKQIVASGSYYEIGSAVTFTELLADRKLGMHFPALVDACMQVGSKQIRNRATIGGNICNASPAADAALALLAFGAEFEITSVTGGHRMVESEQFFTGPGKTILQPGEVLTKIHLPIKEPVLSKFLKIRRTAVDIAIVGVAVVLRQDEAGQVSEHTRIALGAVAPTPVNAKRAAGILCGHTLTPDLIATAARTAVEEISPITDHRASRNYRLELVRVLVEEALLGFMDQGSAILRPAKAAN
ncbi:MAG: FAD binding domain-containing protein [Candidatus Korobacteraceae bacterium]|jgi:carbon-monoxide dehydrogenase medium subunit